MAIVERTSPSAPTGAAAPEPAAPAVPAPAAPPAQVLELTDDMLNGQIHYGLAIEVQSSGKTSTVMIPDVTGVSSGKPVYITNEISLVGTNLKTFLEKKHVTLPSSIAELLGTAEVSCKAFYYARMQESFDTSQEQGPDDAKKKDWQKRLGFIGADGKLAAEHTAAWDAWVASHVKEPGSKVVEVETGPLLMIFRIEFKKGLIGALTGDESLGDLFDFKKADFRVVRGSKNSSVLQDYLRQLQKA